MAKGQNQAWNQAQINKSNLGIGNAAQLGGQGQGIQSTLLPAYQQMLAGPSAAETLNTVGGIGATAGAERDALARRSASTGNPAGFAAGLGNLARTQQQTTADAMAKLTTSDRDKALGGLSNLYGVDTNTMAALLKPNETQFTQPLAGKLIPDVKVGNK